MRELSAQGYAAAHQVATDGDGDSVVIWSWTTQLNYFGDLPVQVRARTVSASGAMGPLLKLARPSCMDARGSQVAIDPRGDALVTWSCDDDGSLQGRRILASGALGPVLTIVGAHDQRCCYPVLDTGADGTSTVVWEGPGERIKARTISADGSLSPIRVLSNANPEQGEGDSAPAVSSAGNGDAIVVWSHTESDPFGYAVEARRVSAAGNPGPLLSVGTGGCCPSLDADSDGGAVVGWWVERSNSIRARTISAHGSLGPERVLSVPSEPDPERPERFSGVRVASDGRGGGVAVWTRFVFRDDPYERKAQPQGRSIPGGQGTLGPLTDLIPLTDLDHIGELYMYPNIATDAEGAPVVVWNTYEYPNIFRIQAAPPFADTTPPEDTTRPDVRAVLNPAAPDGANGFYRSDVGVTWQVSDGESSVTTSGCGPTTINADTPGTTLTCTATSGGGVATRSVSLKRDATAPETEITKGPKKKTKKGKATFKFSSLEPGAAFECSLDRKTFESCSSPEKVSVKKGKHTFDVRAIDQAGNADASPDRQSWKRKTKRQGQHRRAFGSSP